MSDAYPLRWPAGWPRTPPQQQDRGYAFKTRDYTTGGRKSPSFAKARDALREELRKLGARHVVISTNHKPDRYGDPIEAKRRPADDGVALYFMLGERQLAMACDRYDNAAANMRSLALAIEAMRQLERHGGGTMMERAFQGFEALPAPRSCWDILGLQPGARDAEIQAAWRRKARECHPDHGGSDAAMAEVNRARDEALRSVM